MKPLVLLVPEANSRRETFMPSSTMPKYSTCSRSGNNSKCFFRLALLLPFLLLNLSNKASGQSAFHQDIALSEGWNAVYLDVDPTQPLPSELFANLPIDAIAAYVTTGQGAQFVEDPSASLLNAYGWSVWYAPYRSDAFLSSLHVIHGGKPYLIHATSNVTWSVTGTHYKSNVEWVADDYNFVGYTLAEQGGPTFAQFFAGSTAHAESKIYRLTDGIWRQVLNPASTLMRSGEAFWIQCDGHSDYPGPLAATTTSHTGLELSSVGGDELVLRNRANHPLALTIEHRIDGTDTVPLTMPVRVFNNEREMQTVQLDLGGGNWTQDLPTLEAGAAIRLPFTLRLQEMNKGVASSLLIVRSDLGTVNAIPVTATRDDVR